MRRAVIINPLLTQKRTLGIAWLIVGLGAFFYCYEYFLRITPSVMSHSLMHAYHLSANGFGQLSVYYYLAYTPMQLLVGLLIDRYGPKRLLTVAILLCSIGMMMFASLYSLRVAEIGRFLVGFGSAFAFVGALKLATVWLPSDRFASISGFITALGTIGAMVGDLTLTKLVQLEGWQYTLYLSAGIGIVLSVVFFLVVRDHCDEQQAPNQPTILPMLTFRELITSAWIALRKWQFVLNGLIGGLLFLTLSAFGELWGIPYLEQSYQLSQMDAASLVFFVFLGWTFGAPLMGFISDYIQRRRIILTVVSFLAFVDISLVIYGFNWSLLTLHALCLFFGFFASVQVTVFAVGRELSSKNIAGTAISLTNMLVMLGGVICQPLIGKLLDVHWHGQMLHHVRVYTAGDYRFAMTILPIAMAIAFIATFFFKETFPSQSKRTS